MAFYTKEVLIACVTAYLEQAGASHAMASSTARSLVAAEASGLGSHGLSRVSQYASHLRNGRVNAAALPFVARSHGGGVLIDADEGLAFAACELAVEQAIERAREFTISFAGVTRSHHFGVA
ncbi:MAG TPA: Ldh family oxidoreductase, partial [Eoetvoesiella sp.]